LSDYTGAEVFSIEFDLYNLDEKSAKTSIYPKSMVFIPGKFKECESLLLALKPETGYLDVHKSRTSINNISKLFYEVEEFANRPEFTNINRQLFYDKFASRFCKKLFGELIEDKWNKKLIGLSSSLPTEKEMLNPYAKIISNVDILWNKRPLEINLLDSKFEKIKSPFEGQQAIEHLKYSISEPSANFIIDKTLNLGTSLMNLANIGTLDEYQDEIINYLINLIRMEIDSFTEPHTGEWLVAKCNSILLTIEGYLNKFLEYSNMFLTSGEMGDLTDLLMKFKQFIVNKGKLEDENFEEICNIAIGFIKQTVIQKEKLRVVELRSVFNYFSEINKKSLDLIKISLPNYLSRRRLITLTSELIEKLKQRFNEEQKPAKILGIRLIEKFQEYLLNQIEIEAITLRKNIHFNEQKLIEQFNRLVNNNVESFFDNIHLKIEDLV
jgi:antitoxin component HigA of HigAB toxin-antitoxin module